jgi:carbamate kinase
MGPKVDAALRFVEGGPARRAVVTSLENIAAAVAGDADGTVITTADTQES